MIYVAIALAFAGYLLIIGAHYSRVRNTLYMAVMSHAWCIDPKLKEQGSAYIQDLLGYFNKYTFLASLTNTVVIITCMIARMEIEHRFEFLLNLSTPQLILYIIVGLSMAFISYKMRKILMLDYKVSKNKMVEFTVSDDALKVSVKEMTKAKFYFREISKFASLCAIEIMLEVAGVVLTIESAWEVYQNVI